MLKGSTLKALDVRILWPLIETRSAVEDTSAASPAASTGPT
ncbi:coenzyme Q-binding protein COQ10, mitochondrial isoform X3 [Drosophila sechellia]|nr:coenzyme Q-binding protein COQ10, mitochondrial isoform X3 [Drosophila sechellia]XP_039147897.1 coenzyme Q-binding protein COQ10, mitochondrial isoform X4 [Drosophila simulans]